MQGITGPSLAGGGTLPGTGEPTAASFPDGSPSVPSLGKMHGNRSIMQLILDREVGYQRCATPGQAGFQRRMQADMGVWAERDFLDNASAQYANLRRAPRSTIAAAYSAGGQVLASTHGDHTVKIVSCMTGDTVAVLDGHERTPWVVRFNPVRPQVVASGSLDHDVIVWDASSGHQLLSHDFGKPIASVAFHSNGNIMSVASGHKVYAWAYNSMPASQPAVILKTRKSLRALHFHPLGCPLMLTAEVVERKSSTQEAENQAAAAAAAQEAARVAALPLQPPSIPAAATPAAMRSQVPDQAAAAAVAAAVSAVALDAVPGANTDEATVPPPPQEPRPHTAAAGEPSRGASAAAGLFTPAGLPLPAFLGQLAQQRPPVLGQPGNHPNSTGPWHFPVNNEPAAQQSAQQEAQPVPGRGIHTQTPPGAPQVPPAHPNTAAPRPPTAAANTIATQMSALAQLSTYVEAANRASSIAEHNVWLRVLLQQRHQLLPPPTVPHPVSVLQDAMLYEAIAARLASEQRLAPSRGNPFWALLQATGYPWLSGPQSPPRSSSQSGINHMVMGGDMHMDTQPAGGNSAGSAGGGGGGSGGVSPPTGPGSAVASSGSREDGWQGSVCPLIPLVPPPHQEPLNSHAFDLNWGWEVSSVASEAAAMSLREVRSTLLHRQLPVPNMPEQPCIVNLILWPFNPNRHDKPLANPRLQLPRTVLCSEMGACFSRCGRFLAVCVATDEMSDKCTAWVKQRESCLAAAVQQSAGCSSSGVYDMSDDDMPGLKPGQQSPGGPSACQDNTPGAMDTDTRPLPHGPRESAQTQPRGSQPGVGTDTAAPAAKPPIYELRVYSLDGPTFGEILHARPVRAAHCLTSIQLSPTAKHLLVAYGRRHISLCSLLADGGQLTPVHTVIEIFRVSDMQLVRRVAVLEDEVNVAAWHPFPGGGLLYGTKEGKLRLFRHDRRPPARRSIPAVPRPYPLQADEELWEAERSAGRESNSEDD